VPVMGKETFEERKKDEHGVGFLFSMGMEWDILVQCSVTGYMLDPKGFSAVYN